jgi:hypothetical protein
MPPPRAGHGPRREAFRPRDLATEDLELVAQDEQLDVLDVQAPATANEGAQQGPEREVEKREGHGRRSSQPSRRQGATGPLAPFRRLGGHRSRLYKVKPAVDLGAQAASLALALETVLHL